MCLNLVRDVLSRTDVGAGPPGFRGSRVGMSIAARPPARWDDERGFSLIETIIALVILTIGILAVATLSSATIWQVRRGQDLTNAGLVAQQVMEDLTDSPYDSVELGNFSDTITMGGIEYTVVWTVEDLTDSLASGGNEIKEIKIYAGGGLTQTNPEEFVMAIYKAGATS